MPTSMADRVVGITGATGALGRVAAAAFAADGARLGLVGTDRGRLEGVAADLELADDRWAAGVGDLREASGAAGAIGAIRDRLGPPDVLLHLVGGWAGGTPLVDLDPAVLEDMLGQHVWSTFHVVRAVLPAMTDQGWGRIIAVTASAAASPGPKVSAYTAAKAAQETMLRSVAREVAAVGVTVNTLSVKAIDADHERETSPSPKNAGWTTPEEIVAAMRFLCSEPAGAINGARIALDGRA
jgi:NAD(P)-dependent dehydrogenase (short-subunit alcohol dehydrogenase family)